MKSFSKLLCLAAITLSYSSAWAANDAVEQAVKHLAESGSYEWKSELHIASGQNKPASIVGRYNFNQGLHLKLTLDEKTLEVAARDGVVVASTGDEWKPLKKFTRSDPVQAALRGLIDFTLPHRELESLIRKWRNVREQDDGSYQGLADVTSAKKMLGAVLQQAGKSANAKNGIDSASLKVSIWLEADLPVKTLMELIGGGSGILGGQGSKANVITTLSNIGSTIVTLPPEAETAIQAAKQP